MPTKAPRIKKPPNKPTPTPNTLAAVVEELRGLRRDMVVLCRVIVEGQKTQKRSLIATLKKAEEPGSLSANVDMPSWYDAVHEANQEAGG